MKTKSHYRSSQFAAGQPAQRPAGGRLATGKSFEHRYERRKIRERLRSLDWALNIKD